MSLTASLPEDPVSSDPISDAAESSIQEKRLGERVKALRLKKSMGLVELGRHTGLSASFLSQIETGRVVPTLRNLARIALVFSKDLSYFFEPEPRPLFRIHRANERVKMPQSGTENPAYYFENLGYLVPDRQLDPYLAEFLPPQPGRETRAHQHPGHEFLYLLHGQLQVTHDGHIHLLEAHDAIYFDSGTIHSYQCVGEALARALIISTQGAQPVDPAQRPATNGTSGSRRLAVVNRAPQSA